MNEKEKIKKYLLGKHVEIVTSRVTLGKLDNYFTIISYDNKVIEVRSRGGTLAFIPWTAIESIIVL